jgi:hypothetical protein
LAERAENIVFEWIILAALAAVILYQLYATLGRRVGRQPEDAPAVVPANASTRDLKAPETPPEALSGLAALRARQADFDIGQFLSGARQAYEMIVKAFAAGAQGIGGVRALEREIPDELGDDADAGFAGRGVVLSGGRSGGRVGHVR